MNALADPNHRPLRVLGFLAQHATESFTLAEIMRGVGLSKGSAHRVMAALAEAGFVTRHPRHKTYALGMALVAIGQAALERHPGIAIARREMARLHAETGLGFGATAIVNGEYLLLGREGTPRSADGLSIVGERRLLLPSIGIGLLAWRDEAEIAAWLESGAACLSAQLLDHVRAALPVVRRRGYAMAANGQGLQRLLEATVIPIGAQPVPSPAVLARFEGVAAEELQLLDAEGARGRAGQGRGVNYISAPVFLPSGEACLEIVASGMAEGLDAAAIERLATRVVRAADIVTAEIRGRKPAATA